MIADIISFQDNASFLKDKFNTTEIDWDSLVTIASEHLILPTIFFKLKEKALLEYIPVELNHYLTELASINRNRNNSLLSEIKTIATLFKSNAINYVFIKGAALIAGKFYADIGERMVGDLDILVDDKDLHKAFNLLVKEGYDKLIPFNYEQKDYRHLPRQVSNNCLAAVELHSYVLKTKYKDLIDAKQLLSTKTVINEVNIPNLYYFNSINILTAQINDRGTYFLSIPLKHAYDSQVLKLDQEKQLLTQLLHNKHGLTYLSLIDLLFPEAISRKSTLKERLIKMRFKLKMNNPKLAYFVYKIKWITINCIDRLNLFITNKSYRTHIIKNKTFIKS